MSKSIQIMAIAVAFIALTLISGVVYADEKNAKPFAAIWDAINAIQLTPGPQGATGPAGADGTNAITNVYSVQEPVSIPGGAVTTVKATCNGGDKVLGGGYENDIDATILADKPDGDKGWLVEFERGSSDFSKTVTVYAICAATP